MKHTRDKYFLLENDIVVLRNGDKGLVIKDGIVLQNGNYFLRHIYEKKNKFSQYINKETKYDIIKIYHDNKNEGVAYFNLADNDLFLVWEEKRSFPKLENGDVIILNNGNIYMKVDHIFVNKLGGHMKVYDYDNNGKLVTERDGELIERYDDNVESWNIKKVYRNWYAGKPFYDFNIVNYGKALIWERC